MPAYLLKLFFAGVSVFLLMVACSSNVGVPALPRSDQPIDRILMRGQLDPQNVREIFSILNEKGTLNGLKPWISEASDDDLRTLGHFIRKYLYEDAYDQGSLRGLIERRSQNSGFSDWAMRAEKNGILKSFVPLFSKKGFPTLLNRDFYFLSREFHDVAQALHTNVTLEVPTHTLAQETLQFISAPENPDRISRVSESLQHSDFGTSLLNALAFLKKKHNGDNAFRGFARTIKNKSAPEKNDWGKILKLAAQLNRPSNGIFIEAEKTLRDDEAVVRLLQSRLRSRLAAGVAFSLRTRLLVFDSQFWRALPRSVGTGAPSANFVTLFNTVQAEIKKLISPETLGQDPFSAKRRLLLNTLVLCEWLEKFSSENTPVDLVKSLHSFSAFSFDLKGPAGLSERLKRDLKAVAGAEAEPFLKDLEQYLKLSTPGITEYRVRKLAEKTTFENGFRSAVQDLNETLAFGDSSPLVTALISQFTQSTGPFSWTLSSFETESDGSMLRSMHSFLGALSYDSVQRVLHLLFDELELGRLSRMDKDTLCNLVPAKSPDRQFCLDILDNLQLVSDFNRQQDGLPSLVETYHAVLRFTVPEKSGGAENLLSFLDATGLFSSQAGNAAYPTILKVLRNENFVTEMLSKLASLGEENRRNYLYALNRALETRDGISGTDLHLQLFGELAVENPKEMTALLAAAFDDGWAFLPSETLLSFPERDWMARLANRGDAEKFWGFVQARGSIENSRQLVRELESLSRKGHLKEAFHALSLAQDERLKLIATTLLKWDDSGELRSFLRTLKNIIEG